MKSEQFTHTIKLRAEHVNYNRSLKLSSLLLFSQEMCIHHTELLGMGRKKTLNKGLLWIINKQVFEINRMPKYDEEITLVTYPGIMLHFFFPRHFKILDSQGKTIIKGATLWSLMNAKSRKIIDPLSHGVKVDGKEDGSELPVMFLTKAPLLTKKQILKADFHNCDLNGHLTNSAYVDFVESLMDTNYLLTHEVCKMEFSFNKEIKLGEEVKVDYGNKDDDYYFTSADFFIHLKYKNK